MMYGIIYFILSLFLATPKMASEYRRDSSWPTCWGRCRCSLSLKRTGASPCGPGWQSTGSTRRVGTSNRRLVLEVGGCGRISRSRAAPMGRKTWAESRTVRAWSSSRSGSPRDKCRRRTAPPQAAPLSVSSKTTVFRDK